MKINIDRIKEKVTIENILCFFIIICPILDMLSFIFRNVFNTKISPSTILLKLASVEPFPYNHKKLSPGDDPFTLMLVI